MRANAISAETGMRLAHVKAAVAADRRQNRGRAAVGVPLLNAGEQAA